MIQFIKKRIHNLVSDQKFSEILSGLFWSFSAQMASAVLGMINSIIVARFYGASVLGVVAILNSFLMVTTLFTVLGTDTSILKLIPEHIAKYSPGSAFRLYRKMQLFIAGISLLTGACLFFSSEFVAKSILSKPYLSEFFEIAAFFVIFQSIVQLNTQAARGLRLIRFFAFMQFFPFFLKLTILILITIFFFNQYNPIYAMFAAIALTSIVSVWFMNRSFKKKINPTDKICEIDLKDVLHLSLPMLMTSAMYFIIGETGVMVLGIFKSEADVGFYAVAVRLASLTTYILQATGSMAAPKYSELFHTGKIDELFHIAKKSTKLIVWTTIPIVVTLLLFGDYILRYIYGNEFTASYAPLIILLVGFSISMASGTNGLFMNMTGNQKVFRNIMFSAAAANVGLNFLLTPSYGIYGAAFAATLSLSLWNISTLFYMKKKFGRTIGYFSTK
jgi:O-antigen/teichoic acid export membrane protein